jgi:predicted ATPase
LVGRRRELAELRKKLTSARLVSLVGPGGVGKTRLAIRLASDVARGFSGRRVVGRAG